MPIYTKQYNISPVLTAEVAILQEGPPDLYIVISDLTPQGLTDLDRLVAANGNVLPLATPEIMYTTVVSSGQSWYKTYKSQIREQRVRYEYVAQAAGVNTNDPTVTAAGRNLMTAATSDAQRVLLQAASVAQGIKADSAVQTVNGKSGNSVVLVASDITGAVRTVNGSAPDGNGNVAITVSGATVSAANISDSTAAGRALLTAADVSAQRSSLGLGSAAVSSASSFANSTQGTKADSAVQTVNGKTGTAITLVAADVSGSVRTVNGSAPDGNGNVAITVGSTYTLPFASASTLGGIRVGGGLAIAGDGTLSATGGATVSNATGSATGLIQLAGDLGGTATSPTVPGLATKQATLVSGTNIRSVNGASLLGSGNLDLGGSVTGIVKSNGSNVFSAATAGTDYVLPTGNITGSAGSVAWTGVTGKPTTRAGYGITDAQATLVSGTNIKTINGTTLLGSGDIVITAGAAAPTFTAATADTAGRTITASDLGKMIRYNSAAVGTFTIPTDAALGISDATSNVSFEVYQVNTGRVDVVADTANSVTLNKWTGYPTSDRYVTQTFHRVGVNTWAVK